MDFGDVVGLVVVANVEVVGYVVGLEAVAGLGVAADVDAAVSGLDLKLLLDSWLLQMYNLQYM